MRLVLKVDSAEAEAFLQKLEPVILTATELGLRDFIERVANRVRLKLSGQVLRVRSGRLRQSIHTRVTKLEGGFLAQVGTNVKYARIHEYGGWVRLPAIFPVKKKALHFFIGSKEIFAKFVRAHAIRIPERSYLRSSLAELTPFAPAIILRYIQNALDHAGTR